MPSGGQRITPRNCKGYNNVLFSGAKKMCLFVDTTNSAAQPTGEKTHRLRGFAAELIDLQTTS